MASASEDFSVGQGRPGLSPSLVLPLYTATLFLSAFLLFSVQPMFTKMVLPSLGGSAAVWNTAVVFFQATLLAGYLYAHLTTRLLGLRRQMLVHGGLLLVVFLALPVSMAQGWVAPTNGSPVLWLVGLLSISVGLPFFAVSATAPLLQKWFSHTDHPSADDPYFLYGGSNLGSLVALIGYLVVIEPLIGLRTQGWAWSIGYAMLVAGIFACGAFLWGRYREFQPADRSEPPRHLTHQVTWLLRGRWLLLSLAPSALLLGVTLHIGTDIAAAPFLWVAPLALYLLSFVLVFARRPLFSHPWVLRGQVVAVTLAVLAVIWPNAGGPPASIPVLFGIHLAALFFSSMACHGELARLRPVTSRLTEFYLLMSLGGVIGGFLTAIVAPLVFDAVLEYPLALILVLLLRPMPSTQISTIWRWIAGTVRLDRMQAIFTRRGLLSWGLDLAIPVSLLWLFSDQRWYRGTREGLRWTANAFEWTGVTGNLIFLVSIGAVAIPLVLFSRRPLRLGLVAAVAVVGLAIDLWSGGAYLLDRQRTFFGVYSVHTVTTRAGEFHVFISGTTNHGTQGTLALGRQEPLTYYTRDGPAGLFFSALSRSGSPVDRIGLVGLGIGTLACSITSDARLTFYEIDGVVEEIARDQRYFHYLEDCGDRRDVVVGDGRLGLAAEPDGAFGVIVLDAFSSDAIPVHMLTSEALQLYLQKLKPGGYLIMHITNNYLDLAPVVGNLAADAGLAARVMDSNVWDPSRFRMPSTWVVLARTEEELNILNGGQPWRILEADPTSATWTDDFSNIVGALRWRPF
jgi:spermidine synthase